MAVDDPWAIDGLQLSALEWRRAASGLLLHDADPISARAGVLSGCIVTAAGLTATVGGGQLVITPQVGSNGSYLVGMTATNLAITAQDATYARIDRVIARIRDNSIDGGGLNRAEVAIVTGVPSASPALPAIPGGALELAQLQVPKAGSAVVVVDKRPLTAAAGAPRWFPDTAARDAAIPESSRRPDTIVVIGTGAGMRHEAWDGTEWRRIGAEDEQPFTPAWQQLAVGNGVSVGSWSRVGPQVVVQVMLEFGSTTSVSGTPYIDFAASGLPAAKVGAVGSGVAYDRSAGGFQPLTWMPSDWIVAPGGRVAGTVPWVWAPEDYMRLSMTYLTAEP